MIERHASSIATSWSLKGRHDRPLFTKGFSCDLTVLWKIKQICDNVVETRLGLTDSKETFPCYILIFKILAGQAGLHNACFSKTDFSWHEIMVLI